MEHKNVVIFYFGINKSYHFEIRDSALLNKYNNLPEDMINLCFWLIIAMALDFVTGRPTVCKHVSVNNKTDGIIGDCDFLLGSS